MRFAFEQAVDEQPVAFVRRHPARRSVRLGQIAVIGQFLHFDADAGRTDPKIVFFSQILRRNRLGRLDVLLDYGIQYVFLPVADLHILNITS